MNRTFVIFSLLAFASALGCGTSHGSASAKSGERFGGEYPVKVVCTTGMVADLVRNVGGSHVEVVQLMGEGVDPHLYKASPRDVSELTKSDAIFYSGMHLEGKMADLFVRMAHRKKTVPVTEKIVDAALETDDGAYDPHVWFDVSLWRQALDVVRDELADLDPEHASEYRENAEKYGQRLDALHQYAKAKLNEIPADRRVLVTAHDAFRYFGRAYDIEVRGIQGISTESEAGVKEINDLVDFITNRKIKAVFVESSVSDKNMQALIEGCRARGHEVVVGGELYSDAMGKPGTPQGTYEGMVTHNVETIAEALK
jgi:manganese/zinc/iron transport system substrate-binding protein